MSRLLVYLFIYFSIADQLFRGKQTGPVGSVCWEMTKDRALSSTPLPLIYGRENEQLFGWFRL